MGLWTKGGKARSSAKCVGRVAFDDFDWLVPLDRVPYFML